MRTLLVALVLFLARPGQTCGFYPPRVFLRFGKLEVKGPGKATLSAKLGSDVFAFTWRGKTLLAHNGVALGTFTGKPIGEVLAMGIRYALIADGDKITTVMLV